MPNELSLPGELEQRQAPPVFTPIPPEWETRLHEFRSLAEMKVVFYVLRHTYGFQEYGSMKRITMDELMHGRKKRDGTRIDQGTGEAKSTLKIGIKQAIEDKFLYMREDRRDMGRIAKYYAIRLDTSDEEENGSVRGSESDPGGPITDPLNFQQNVDNSIRGSDSDPAGTESDPGVSKADPARPTVDHRSEIDTPDTHFKIDTQIDTAASPPAVLNKNEKEDGRDGPPPPSSEAEQHAAAEAERQRSGEEAARTVELEKKQAARAEAQAAYKALSLEHTKLSGQWGALVRALNQMEPGSLEYERASAEVAAYRKKLDELEPQVRAAKQKAEED